MSPLSYVITVGRERGATEGTRSVVGKEQNQRNALAKAVPLRLYTCIHTNIHIYLHK